MLVTKVPSRRDLSGCEFHDFLPRIAFASPRKWLISRQQRMSFHLTDVVFISRLLIRYPTGCNDPAGEPSHFFFIALLELVGQLLYPATKLLASTP